MSGAKQVVNFLKKNKGYGFKPTQIAQQLNITLPTVYNTMWRYKNDIEAIKVSYLETYYLIKES